MSEIPSDSHLKEVRDSLIGDVVEQGRRLGAVLPDLRRAQTFIDPIMRKVEVQTERESHAIAHPPVVDKTVRAGESYGEVGHSPIIREGAELKTQALGEYAVSGNGKITPKNGAPMPKSATVLELIIKKMIAHPSWREPILIATKICDRHMSALPGCVLCERRESRLLEIVAKAKTTFTTQRERRLLVGGK